MAAVKREIQLNGAVLLVYKKEIVIQKLSSTN